MNTLIHELRFDRSTQGRARLRRLGRDGLSLITAAILFAVIFGASVLLRLLALPSTHAAIAEALHAVGEAMAPPF